ncbi:MAG: glycosyltransferase family 4 protein [Ferruginibacter sp.]
MKRILYLSFYFEPDLCAGSFRNSPLAKELADQLKGTVEVDVITTLPNRYSTFESIASQFEKKENLTIHRILIPKHKSGFIDQMNSFKTYFLKTNKLIKHKTYDLVFASSSRLFTAYLGYSIARKLKVPLYLDVRDIFIDTMKDVIKNPVIKTIILPFLKIIERKVFTYANHINLISGGFKTYFEKFNGPCYSTFSNGIDPEFLNLPASLPHNRPYRLITYAGNLGEGQGLHIIVPEAAKMLGKKYRFLIIGDGGVKHKLISEIERLQLTNVELRNPVSRKELLEIYADSDFLFLHLNQYDAFKKVLPSKIFELGAYDKPIIAGVAGFSNEFIAEYISNRILFPPGEVEEMVKQLEVYKYHTSFRKDFKDQFKRETINREMSRSIINYL